MDKSQQYTQVKTFKVLPKTSASSLLNVMARKMSTHSNQLSFVKVREQEREKEGEKGRKRESERIRESGTESEREKERERGREGEGERERERERECVLIFTGWGGVER